MNTTTTLNYQRTRDYALSLFNSADKQAYSHSKKAESILILIATDTGLRVSDLLELRFSSITTENQFGKPFLIAKVKKKKTTQTLPLTSTTYRLIEVFYQFIKNNNGIVDDLIFFNYKNGKTFTRQWTHKRLNAANDEGKLGKKVAVAGAHSLRRTAGHHIYSETKDLRTVQFMLGHSRIQQTEHYLKLDEQTAMEKLQACFH